MKKSQQGTVGMKIIFSSMDAFQRGRRRWKGSFRGVPWRLLRFRLPPQWRNRLRTPLYASSPYNGTRRDTARIRGNSEEDPQEYKNRIQ